MLTFSDFKINLWQNLTVLCSTVILIFGLLWGWRAGIQQAQSDVVAKNTQAALQALQYFHQDQEQYPSELQFAAKDVMINYLTNFPLKEFSSSGCQQSYTYKRLSFQSFELDVCLSRSAGGLQRGWNQLTN